MMQVIIAAVIGFVAGWITGVFALICAIAREGHNPD